MRICIPGGRRVGVRNLHLKQLPQVTLRQVVHRWQTENTGRRWSLPSRPLVLSPAFCPSVLLLITAQVITGRVDNRHRPKNGSRRHAQVQESGCHGHRWKERAAALLKMNIKTILPRQALSHRVRSSWKHTAPGWANKRGDSGFCHSNGAGKEADVIMGWPEGTFCLGHEIYWWPLKVLFNPEDLVC